MVAILVPQPGDAARDRHPAAGPPVPLRRRAAGARSRPVDLASVEPVHPRPASRALPDRPTRIRRRRLAALVTAVALIGATVAGGGALLGAASSVEPSSPQPVEAPPLSPAVGQTYVVKPGDTLWSIAAAIAPGSDPRPVVHALRAANGAPDIQVGQRLTIRTD
ncbi:MAG: LysM peptidoglycan-binding domain-containing protein [Acidimicrobiales bacterium]